MTTPEDTQFTLETLAATADRYRAEGKTIALCHGVFDVLHIGHLKHIKAAKAEADVLFVTVTADEFVRKGPGRPFFPEYMRAEMLAGLEDVAGAAIVHEASAIPAIKAVRPDVYVKGADYETAENDVTRKIVDEKDAVESVGGRLHHTREITFSSSNLINNFLADYDPKLREFLKTMRERDGLQRLKQLIDDVADRRVLVVGDAIIDEYHFVSSLGRSAKENIIATLSKRHERYAGGVFAVANHLASFCDRVDLVTVLGADNSFQSFIDESLLDNVNFHAIEAPGRPTTRKTRFVDEGYTRKLFEVYDMNDRPLPAEIQARVHDAIGEHAREADLVVVCDFGHGLIASETIDVLEREAKFLAVNVQTNAGNQGFNHVTKFNRADLICVDAPEARFAVGEKFKPIEEIITEDLPANIACPLFIVTHGIYGCYAYHHGGSVVHIPAFTNTVVDTVGAGDAFFSLAAILAANGAEPVETGFGGNAAGALKVGIVGHRKFIDRVAVIKYITALLS